MAAKAIQEKKALEEYLIEIDKTLGYFAMQASRKAGLDIDDARQEMLIQAWKAYETYDPEIAKFTTYAGWRMKQRIKSLIKRSFLHSTPILIQDMANANLQDPTASATEEVERQGVVEDREEALDEIEEILERTRVLRSTRENEIACKVFAGLRNGKSLSAISKEEQIQLPRLSTVFTRRVKKLGTLDGRSRIVKQIEEIESKSAKARKEKGMAKETKKAERATRKGGMTDKIEYVRQNFVAKGKSRSEAIAGLQTKYPDMSANYAKTLVYGKMKDEKFAKSERKAHTPKAPKAAKKGSKILPSKKVAAKKPATAAKPKDANFDF
jgi:RNA polymerase sigma factor (sigma-70 family)